MNRHRSRARRGYTLVFFAMFLFGFMALAALVIDIGFARLAQRQMQTAVDAAALEGLRFRDELSDFERREQASRTVAWTFDDNLDPDDGDLIGFGAGPVVELGPPIPDAEDLNAGQLLTLPDTPFYKPVLQLNTRDERHGDIVAGRYTAGRGHNELPSYERDDFEPNVARDAFLVRMRRSNDFQDYDNQPGVSSHGPPIPYLFGRGAFLPARDPNSGYSPRHHGMTVRATGIADARRVLSVGMPDDAITPPLAGLARFALALHYWDEAKLDDEDELDDAPLRLEDGEIVRETDLRVEGIFFLPGQIDDMPVVIGRGLPDADAPEDGSYTGYVPIYADISGVPRVIGFGLAEAVVAPDPVTSEPTVTITRYESRIAAENASAIVCYAWDVNGDDLIAVLQKNGNLPKSLLAPVSVR